MGKSIVIASGKGGTGKTMVSANLGATLSRLGHQVIVIDMDTGLRNLDLYLGLENNVVYDVNDVMNGVCRIKQPAPSCFAAVPGERYPRVETAAASDAGFYFVPDILYAGYMRSFALTLR